MLKLTRTKKSDPRLLALMPIHYSQPKEFVGRSLHYAITFNDIYYGYISGGSALLLSRLRDEFFKIQDRAELVHYINNVFFHVEKVNGYYPTRNFTTLIVLEWEKVITQDWFDRYRDEVRGYETLVEPPRMGELYLRGGYTFIGSTQGYHMKREGNKLSTIGGKKVYEKVNLRPKLIFCKKV